MEQPEISGITPDLHDHDSSPHHCSSTDINQTRSTNTRAPESRDKVTTESRTQPLCDTDAIEPCTDTNNGLANGPRMRKNKFTQFDALDAGLKPEEVEQMLKDSLPKDGDIHSTTSSEILAVAARAAEHAEEFVRNVWRQGWRVVHHSSLPPWLKDNDYLLRGHRPQLNSFLACFKSIFRIHTETGNIWTHLLAFIALIAVAVMFVSRPSIEVQWQDKCVFLTFLAGAILCMGFSWIFHTVCCHSEKVGKLFNKLDYCGIALLTMGSFVPWLYYSFYCRVQPRVVYLMMTTLLGTACIVISLWDRFSEPKFRALRAGVFIAFGLSGCIPAVHYCITDGVYNAFYSAALGWLVLMAVLYITGALIYAARFPERLFPGKFDIWFQSHQIFHTFVVAAAFVHYHGISVIATYRLSLGDCVVPAE